MSLTFSPSSTIATWIHCPPFPIWPAPFKRCSTIAYMMITSLLRNSLDILLAKVIIVILTPILGNGPSISLTCMVSFFKHVIWFLSTKLSWSLINYWIGLLDAHDNEHHTVLSVIKNTKKTALVVGIVKCCTSNGLGAMTISHRVIIFNIIR